MSATICHAQGAIYRGRLTPIAPPPVQLPTPFGAGAWAVRLARLGRFLGVAFAEGGP